MTGGGRDFGEGLRSLRGPCPSAAEMQAFASGADDGVLTGADRARIQSHIRLCGLCDVLLSRMLEISEKDDEETHALPPGVAERMQSSFDRFLAAESQQAAAVPLPPQRRRAWPLMSLGWAAALLLAIPAVQHWREKEPAGTKEQQPPAVLQPPVMSSPPRTLAGGERYELENTRGASAAPSSGVRLKSGLPGEVILSFALPPRPGVRYTAEIRRAGGAAVGASSPVWPSEDGYSYLVCSRAALPPGEYRLHVRGEPDAAEQVFGFTVVP